MKRTYQMPVWAAMNVGQFKNLPVEALETYVNITTAAANSNGERRAANVEVTYDNNDKLTYLKVTGLNS